jgi:putative hemolysin
MDDLLLLLLLILLNGVFAMSEIAVVSARKARLQALVDEGRPGAAAALALAESPSRFLSTIQVGITSIGILAGAIGDDALAAPLTHWLGSFTATAEHAEGIALALVVAGLTYFSVVVGELVPKRLGLLAPERVASVVAAPMNLLARIANPVVTLLAASADALFRLLNIRGRNEPPITNEEIKVLMEQGAEAGIFHAAERQLVANVLHLDDQTVRAVMTPRQDIDALNLADDEAALQRALAATTHSRLPAYRGDYGQIIGVLHTGDLLKRLIAGERPTLAECVRPAHFVPETITLSRLLENLREARTTIALVVDEYGDLQGLVTIRDILDAIVGSLVVDDIDDQPEAVRREDGTWLVDGAISIERLKQVLDVNELPGEDEGNFHTAAGFALHVLGHIPAVAERFEIDDYLFEVVDMDGHRIDKLLVVPRTH